MPDIDQLSTQITHPLPLIETDIVLQDALLVVLLNVVGSDVFLALRTPDLLTLGAMHTLHVVQDISGIGGMFISWAYRALELAPGVLQLSVAEQGNVTCKCLIALGASEHLLAVDHEGYLDFVAPPFRASQAGSFGENWKVNDHFIFDQRDQKFINCGFYLLHLREW